MNTRNSMLWACVFAAALGGCSKAPSSGKITIDGSATMYPLSKAMGEAFEQEHPTVRVATAFSGTVAGFRKFCAGEVDIEDASRPINETEIEQCKSNHIDYIELPVGFDSLAVMVNPKNTFVDCLNVKELKAIWEPAAEGKLTNWSQVRPGFPSLPLVLFGPGKDSGTFDYFTLAIVGTQSSSRTDYTASEDDMVLERGVAGDANALGYFGFAYYQANREQLKIVGVDSGHGCVLPSVQTVADHSYQPLTRPLLLYVSGTAGSRPEVKDFLHLYLSLTSSKIVSKVGYVPLQPKALTAQTARLDEGIKGSIFGGHGAVIGALHDMLNPTEEEKVKAQLVQ